MIGLHLHMNGTHFYNFRSEDNTRNYKLPDILRHEDTELVKSPHFDWWFSETLLRLDGFVMEIVHREHTGYDVITEWPEWWSGDKTQFPEHMDTFEAIQTLLESFNFTVYGEHEVEPFNPYERHIERSVTYESLPVSRWIEREGQPAPTVDFHWRASFPAVVTTFKELWHLFPCQIQWSDQAKKALKAQIIEVIGTEHNVYLHDDIYWSPKHLATFRRDFPSLTGADLNELAAAYANWHRQLMADLMDYRRANETPCPHCHGKGYMAPDAN